MADIEKVAWLWNETNQYIEDFFTTVESGHFLQVKAEDMWSDPETTVEICEFVGAQVSRQAITKMLDRKINQQHLGRTPLYQQWSYREKANLQQYVLLDGAYDYRL